MRWLKIIVGGLIPLTLIVLLLTFHLPNIESNLEIVEKGKDLFAWAFSLTQINADNWNFETEANEWYVRNGAKLGWCPKDECTNVNNGYYTGVIRLKFDKGGNSEVINLNVEADLICVNTSTQEYDELNCGNIISPLNAEVQVNVSYRIYNDSIRIAYPIYLENVGNKDYDLVQFRWVLTNHNLSGTTENDFIIINDTLNYSLNSGNLEENITTKFRLDDDNSSFYELILKDEFEENESKTGSQLFGLNFTKNGNTRSVNAPKIIIKQYTSQDTDVRFFANFGTFNKFDIITYDYLHGGDAPQGDLTDEEMVANETSIPIADVVNVSVVYMCDTTASEDYHFWLLENESIITPSCGGNSLNYTSASTITCESLGGGSTIGICELNDGNATGTVTNCKNHNVHVNWILQGCALEIGNFIESNGSSSTGGTVIMDLNVTIDVATPPADSCTYPGSGDWEVQMSDNCNITDVQNATGNTIILQGDAGTFTIAPTGEVYCRQFHFNNTDLDGDAQFKIETGGLFVCGIL